MKNCQRFEKWLLSNYKYFFLYLILFTFIFLAWLIFIHNKQITDIALKIGGVISTTGLGFTLFQFGFNHITTNKRRLYDLRYNAYKEIILQIDAIGEALNEVMSSKKISEVYSLLGKVTNQSNRVGSTLNESNDFLFIGILNTTESIEVRSIIDLIDKRCKSYKLSVGEVIKKDGNLEKNNFLDTVQPILWQNDVNGYIKQLHEKKYNLYSKLREYLN